MQSLEELRKGKTVNMSWYSDGERFNEHEPEYCKRCTRENLTKGKCDRCFEEHEVITYCNIYACEDCPRYGDDCDGDPDGDSSETL